METYVQSNNSIRGGYFEISDSVSFFIKIRIDM